MPSATPLRRQQRQPVRLCPCTMPCAGGASSSSSSSCAFLMGGPNRKGSLARLETPPTLSLTHTHIHSLSLSPY
jgi:hypothetical protein